MYCFRTFLLVTFYSGHPKKPSPIRVIFQNMVKTADIINYSSSIVPGGLEVRSYMTRFTPLTSLMMRLVTLKRTS